MVPTNQRISHSGVNTEEKRRSAEEIQIVQEEDLTLSTLEESNIVVVVHNHSERTT